VTKREILTARSPLLRTNQNIIQIILLNFILVIWRVSIVVFNLFEVIKIRVAVTLAFRSPIRCGHLAQCLIKGSLMILS
jgi:hypothetical protein